MPAPKAPEGTHVKRLMQQAREAFDRRLAAVANRDLHPEGVELVAAGRRE